MIFLTNLKNLAAGVYLVAQAEPKSVSQFRTLKTSHFLSFV